MGNVLCKSIFVLLLFLSSSIVTTGQNSEFQSIFGPSPLADGSDSILASSDILIIYSHDDCAITAESKVASPIWRLPLPNDCELIALLEQPALKEITEGFDIIFQDQSKTTYILNSLSGEYQKIFEWNHDHPQDNWLFQLGHSLTDSTIHPYYKEILKKREAIWADESLMLSIPEKLFTAAPNNRLFFFLVFTASMNGADGFYSEALAVTSHRFILENPAIFAEYFNNVLILENQDLINWAASIYGEIQISNEGNEKEIIQKLEQSLRKEYEVSNSQVPQPLSNLIMEIKQMHSENN